MTGALFTKLTCGFDLSFRSFSLPNTNNLVIFNNSFYNGLAINDKHYSYGQQVYIPESYPNHYYNTNMFSPLFLAMNKEKKQEEEL